MSKFHKSKVALFVASAAATAFSLPNLSFAQSGGVLEEIVVTATKRAQTLQEIPIAVTVTTADTIEKAQIQDINDLQSVVPSLRVSQLQNSINTNFTIRGFGNGANNPGIEPSVGVFIDGVYRSRSAASITDLPKLERVEVLRGPQSTLFGKNASAGVISVVTAKPSGERSARVSLSVGNYSAVVAKGYYEDAISDSVAFSLYASHNTRDGYATNNVTGTELNDRDRQAFRGQLLFTPSDVTEIRFIVDYDTLDEVCCAVNNLVAGPTVPALQALGGQVNPNDPEALSVFFNGDPQNEVDNSGISMQIDHEFETFALTSITSFRNVDSFYSIDVDFSSAALARQNINTDIDTFSQEIRLTSTAGDSVDWMVGGYYFDESIEYSDRFPFGADFRGYTDLLSGGGVTALEQALGFPAGTFFSDNIETLEQGGIENEAYSLFGSLDWHISDQLTATFGLNYTKDEKEANFAQPQGTVFGAIDLVQVGTGLIAQTLIGQGVPPAIALQQAGALATNPEFNPLLGLQALQFIPPFVDFPNVVEDGKTDDDELTYNFRLAYDLNDSVNIYGGVSTGFKASSWNLSRDSRPTAQDVAALAAAGIRPANLIPGTRFAGPEEATVYELGLKARFERGSLNLAIFDQSIEGFQSNAFRGTGFNLVNAGEQSTTGIEFDLVYYPVDALKLSLSGTFLDPEYDSFVGAGRDPLTGQVVDLSGETPGGINETSISAGFTYNFALGNNEAFFSADYLYEDTIPVGDLDTSQFTRDSRNLNLAAGITTANGLNLTLWGRNVTDHVSLIQAFPSVAQAGSFSGYRTPPRTYGVTLTKDF